MVKCRIISDIHYTKGINGGDKNYSDTPFGYHFDKELKKETDCVTLIAGDILEGTKNHENFFKSAFPNQEVIFVEGNHSVYDSNENVLPEIKKHLKEKFPKTNGSYHYLENDWMFIPNTNNSVAIIGSTLYTDYAYCDLTLNELNEKKKAFDFWINFYGLPTNSKPYERLNKKVIQTETMAQARSYLNDFKWGKENKFTYLSPEYYLTLHKLAKKEIKRCYKEIISINHEAKVILMTHHCLSPRCISEKYKKGLMNASYTSDLEKWMEKEFPNLKLVISGHIHNRCDFTFGKNNIRYITNPCGYIPYNEPFEEKKFNPNLIIDTNDL